MVETKAASSRPDASHEPASRGRISMNSMFSTVAVDPAPDRPESWYPA
jgi:hypothetical protein